MNKSMHQNYMRTATNMTGKQMRHWGFALTCHGCRMGTKSVVMRSSSHHYPHKTPAISAPTENDLESTSTVTGCLWLHATFKNTLIQATTDNRFQY